MEQVHRPPDSPGRSSSLSSKIAPDPLVGTRYRNYRILSVCGEGTLSRVYKARDAILDRDVALKITRTEAPEFAPLMLRREARILARLAPHPAIVPIFEGGAIEGRAFIALEYLPHSLESVLDRYPKGLPMPHALAMGIDAARALGHAHEHGIIHRDVKPSSILLDESERSLRLSDFNLAAMIDVESGTASSGANGTFRYMSPEQCEGSPLTPASDVYTLGVTLLELLLGSGEMRVERLPVPIASCIEKATAEDPAERFADGREFARALKKVAAPAIAAVSLQRERAS